jgi:uncharacterized protein (DUF2147 family)
MCTILRSAAVGATLAALAAGPLASAAFAQPTGSPVGLWKSIDDETKKPTALIRIEEAAGALVGRIEKILTDKADAVCDKCTDARKDKPVQGMTILTGLKKEGEEWTGGEILDPNNGKLYKAKLKLAEAGRKLELRGYIGIPTLGRTQTWIREN